jgi:hypothetical protein
MADLWCVPCEQSHRFTEGEVERLVYALQVEAERRRDQEPGDVDPDDDGLCLEHMHTVSLCEYREQVDARVSERREFGRRRG